MLNQPGKSSTQHVILDSVQQLIYNHPFAFWSGLWSSIVVVTAVAALGLLSVGPVEEEEPAPSPTPVVVQPPETPQPSFSSQAPLPSFIKVQEPPQNQGVPLWLFGVIGLTCAAGSLLIARQMTASPPRKLTKRVAKSVKPTVNNTFPKKRASKRRSTTLVPTSRYSGVYASTSIVPTNTRLPEVTVVPASENHPLDWGDDNLAEMMDLRKRHSLASLLRDR